MGERRVYQTLDAMRGLAALVVVCRHAVAVMGPYRPIAGYLPVDLFFVISGFVISHAYDDRLAAGMTSLEFLRRRIIRLYPLYLLGLALSIIDAFAGLLLQAGTHWPSAKAIGLSGVIALAGLPTPTAISGSPLLFPLNSAFWSLLFEFLANIVFVFGWRWIKGRILILLISGCAMALTISCLLQNKADLGASWPEMPFAVPRVLYSFFLGVLIKRTGFTLKMPPYLAYACPVILAFAPIPNALRGTVDAITVAILLPLSVAIGAASEPKGRFVAVASLLGITSYAIYVLHAPLIHAYDIALHKLQLAPEAHAPFYIFGLVSIVLFSAWFCDRFYDLPLRQALTQRLDRPRAPPAKAAA